MAETAASVLAAKGVSAEVVDLRSLAPLDRDTLLASVAKTGHLVVVEEDSRTCGMGAELLALAAEEAWGALAGPPQRIAAADTPVPFAPALEEAIAPRTTDVVHAALALLGEAPRAGNRT
jgi:pyruvate/2-oxoglutarate/acetoin dehydrogenase E1 component